MAPWAPRDTALLLIANRPLVQHAVDALRRAGVDETVVVAEADTATTIRHLLGSEADSLRFVELGHAPTAAEAILAAADLLDGQRFLVHSGEGLLVRDQGTLATALAAEEADAAVFFHADRDGGPRLSLRRRREEAEPEHRLAGVHVFGPRFLDVLRDTPANGDRVRLADAIERLAEAGGRVQGGVLENWWRHRGTPEDLLEVNRRVLDEMPPTDDTPSSEDLVNVRLEGRVHVHPTAIVKNAFVRGPAIIGAHARVTDSYVGPYSSIGDGAEIENAEIACSIVLPRARIRHVGVRVEDSIVGPGASVGRDFSLPKAMRLLVGSEAQITLS